VKTMDIRNSIKKMMKPFRMTCGDAGASGPGLLSIIENYQKRVGASR